MTWSEAPVRHVGDDRVSQRLGRYDLIAHDTHSHLCDLHQWNGAVEAAEREWRILADIHARVFRIDKEHAPLRTPVIGEERNARDDDVREARPDRRIHCVGLAGIDKAVFRPDEVCVERGKIRLGDYRTIVLDEADRMLDMGFIRDIKKILAMLPKARQNLLFSATFSDEIKALADGLLNNPGFVEVARRNTASELVEQSVHMISQSFKRELVSHLVTHNNWQQVLVFTRTKHGANRLAEKLVKDGIEAAAIHGNKSQGARTKALAQFKDGTVRVLVATDIAARGLDIDQLPQVINFELPNVPEDYVHRIGRTGRAGSSGAAVSLVDREELSLLKDIEKLIKREIPKVQAEGWVQPEKAEPEAPRAPRPQQRRPQNGSKPQHSRNKPQGQRTDKAPMDGNRNQTQNQSAKNMSEAARHQAMPQPALFAPKPQNRGPNPNAGRNANRNNGGSRGGHTGGGGRGR